MKLDQNLVDAAIVQALERFPDSWSGAAAIYTENGQILTSICFDSPNEIANLCHETGAYCEANRLGLRVTASVCVSRPSPEEPFIILSPCGVCQERLALWGQEVEVAVADPTDPTKWQARKLSEVLPHYWRNAVPNDGT